MPVLLEAPKLEDGNWLDNVSSVLELGAVAVDVTETIVAGPVGSGAFSDKRLDEIFVVWVEFATTPVPEREDGEEEDVNVVIEAEVSELVEAGEFSDN